MAKRNPNQTNWTRAYNEKAYDRLAITIPKGQKQAVEAYAKEHGQSINGLVNELLFQALGLTEAEWKDHTDTNSTDVDSSSADVE